MSARTLTAVAVCCDLCDRAAGISVHQSEAEASASLAGFITWPRPNKHICPGCQLDIDGKAAKK